MKEKSIHTFSWALTSSLGRRVRRHGINGHRHCESRGRDTVDSFIYLTTLLAPKHSDLLTSSGCPSLATQDQNLWQHLSLGPQAASHGYPLWARQNQDLWHCQADSWLAHLGLVDLNFLHIHIFFNSWALSRSQSPFLWPSCLALWGFSNRILPVLGWPAEKALIRIALKDYLFLESCQG